MKQTAVEFLVNQLPIGVKSAILDKIEQAKEMEKEQHKVTAQDFYYGSHSFKDFEQYYNQTFKQQEQ
jgi:hypothetical protein